MKMNDRLTQERLNELLSYDVATGEFTWNETRAPMAPKGSIAGRINTSGYRSISVDGMRFPAHRLAWLWKHGRFPELILDHINGNKLDNRIENLREVSSQQNAWNVHNARSSNKAGRIGVIKSHSADRPFAAEIRRGDQQWRLGYYKTAEEAEAAYIGASTVLADLLWSSAVQSNPL